MYCITVQTIDVTLLISYEDARFELLFTPMSITPLIGMEDARFVLNVSELEFYSP